MIGLNQHINMGDWVGTIGFIIGGSAFIPQFYKIYRNKSAEDISYAFLILAIIPIILITIHLFQQPIHDTGMIIFYIYLGLAYSTMVLQKLFYSNWRVAKSTDIG